MSLDPQWSPLSEEGLTRDLAREYENDPRLKPFVTLVGLTEDPSTDYDMNDFQPFFHEIEEYSEGLEQPAMPVMAVPYTAPFFPDDPSIERVSTDQFVNWGQTVDYQTPFTFVVRSIASVQRVVKWAAEQNSRVRVAGFRHSWSDVFGSPGDVMIMFLPFETLTKLPFKPPPKSWKSELSGKDSIKLVPQVGGRDPPKNSTFCKIMAGTTNDEFRQWCFDNKKWCIPLNVIMVEVTFGGTNGPVCHGSGTRTTTLSDLVVEVVYVDAKGAIQTVDDPEELLAASGTFGLLGVVVSITLQIDSMQVTDMMPVIRPLVLAIPPPEGYTLPDEVKGMMKKQKITQKMIDEARKDFIKRCETDYYLEWFWFPYQKEVWVNTWSNRPIEAPDGSILEYPAQGWFKNGVKSQQLQASVAEKVFNNPLFDLLSGRHQAWLFGKASMAALPNITDPNKALKTFQSEALHFRRGIQNFRCWDTEWEIPVPDTTSGQRDYNLIQRAWWDGISAIYARVDAPVRIALELRLTGGSKVLLAPQRGNTTTAAIEVLTTIITSKKDWSSFMETIASKWTSYPEVKDANGNVLYPRPHWAKQWKGLRVHDKDVEDYFKEDAYKQAFADFRKAFEGIVTKRESTVDETLKRYGNDLMERLIWQK